MIHTHAETEPFPMPPSPESRRIPLETKVVLKFNHFGGFFIEYSANLSQSGVFIRTDAPRPAGSVFIFEIWLGDEFKLVHGIGEVVWTREQAGSDGRPAGMGVRYLKLGGESREIIGRVISEHVAKGGQVFDLWTEGDAEPPAGDSGAAATELSEAPTEEILPMPADSTPVVESDAAAADEIGSSTESLLEMPDLGLDAGAAAVGPRPSGAAEPSVETAPSPVQSYVAERRRRRAGWLAVLILLAAAALGAYLLY